MLNKVLSESPILCLIKITHVITKKAGNPKGLNFRDYMEDIKIIQNNLINT